MSLWSVSDRSTADLMAVFYEQMTRENRESDDALARTKERLRQSDTFAHPFYWAPFILMGVPAY